MDRINPWGGSARRALFLIWLVAALASRAGAEPITYDTHGNVWPWQLGNGGSPGMSGPNVIQFQGVSAGTISPGGGFSLGQFVITAPPGGQSVTYTHAAFSIELNTSRGNQPVPAGSGDVPFSSVEIAGTLDGTVTGAGQSDVVLHIASITPNPPVSILDPPITPILDLPFLLSALSIDPPPTLASISTNGGVTALLASVSAAPEPSSILLFLFGAAALGFWGRGGPRRA
jgi:hypothetical protein